MSDVPEQRPELRRDLAEHDFRRWYWLKSELQAFARKLGLSASGSKDLLGERIAAQLSGRGFSEPSSRPSSSTQLQAPVTASTLIPPGQRCSQVLRAWFVEQIGRRFRFDEAMRRFISDADGTTTLADALKHWDTTRDLGPQPIDPQFEFNRFTRAWRSQHPEATHAGLISAWNDYRSRPVDERGQV